MQRSVAADFWIAQSPDEHGLRRVGGAASSGTSIVEEAFSANAAVALEDTTAFGGELWLSSDLPPRKFCKTLKTGMICDRKVVVDQKYENAEEEGDWDYENDDDRYTATPWMVSNEIEVTISHGYATSGRVFNRSVITSQGNKMATLRSGTYGEWPKI
ncbi:hypothetical protein B0H19DRAFT_1086277 [Mycena capillaripes]|nr:hypothetical protein B0H19DRAFT_1086277 [Mycena capillaripes]